MSTTNSDRAARLQVDNNAREVKLDGRMIDLTRVEFDLLAKLHGHPRTVITNEQLSRSVLGSDWYTGPHSIAVHIGHIRHKLGQSPDEPGFIVNRRGVGYMYDPRGGAPAFAPDAGRTVELHYDEHLVLTAVDPAEAEFFGWHPRDVIGSKFLLASDYLRNLAGSVSLVAALLAFGATNFSISSPVECGDGTSQPARTEVELVLDAEGNFNGMKARVTPIG